MGITSNDAAFINPPLESLITVTSITAGAASAAITLANVNAPGYISIAIDDGAGGTALDAYVTATETGTAPTDPDPTATSGGGRTMLFTADALRQIAFRPGTIIKVYAIGSGTVYVRQYRSSP